MGRHSIFEAAEFIDSGDRVPGWLREENGGAGVGF
ncbi:hypothetical protein X956_00465 [Trueperella pyogenes TP8]|nr:hypothetical protein X956_00465 [Trueperella pyogenes TP8]